MRESGGTSSRDVSYSNGRAGQADSNTPYLVGGALLAGTALYLLWPKRSGPARVPVFPSPTVPLQIPQATGVTAEEVATIAREAARREFEARETAEARAESAAAHRQVPNAPLGYSGPGMYRILASNGLSLRETPSTNRTAKQILPVGTLVEVVTVTTNGWAQISTPDTGYLCMSCAEAPNGPWLVQQP